MRGECFDSEVCAELGGARVTPLRRLYIVEGNPRKLVYKSGEPPAGGYELTDDCLFELFQYNYELIWGSRSQT